MVKNVTFDLGPKEKKKVYPSRELYKDISDRETACAKALSKKENKENV